VIEFVKEENKNNLQKSSSSNPSPFQESNDDHSQSESHNQSSAYCLSESIKSSSYFSEEDIDLYSSSNAKKKVKLISDKFKSRNILIKLNGNELRRCSNLERLIKFVKKENKNNLNSSEFTELASYYTRKYDFARSTRVETYLKGKLQKTCCDLIDLSGSIQFVLEKENCNKKEEAFIRNVLTNDFYQELEEWVHRYINSKEFKRIYDAWTENDLANKRTTAVQILDPVISDFCNPNRMTALPKWASKALLENNRYSSYDESGTDIVENTSTNTSEQPGYALEEDLDSEDYQGIIKK
jgi:hypothetical protein